MYLSLPAAVKSTVVGGKQQQPSGMGIVVSRGRSRSLAGFAAAMAMVSFSWSRGRVSSVDVRTCQ